MANKLLTKNYLFGFILLLASLTAYWLTGRAGSSSQGSAATRLLALSLFILLFFDLLKVSLDREKTSYRSMLMERPLFNPKGRPASLSLSEPLYPRFIAVYLDRESSDPYRSRVYSLQAVRYEQGYLSDALFLPLEQAGAKQKSSHLSLLEALSLLRIYAGDFPLIVHEKEFAAAWLREHSGSALLRDAADTEGLAKMIYPSLTEYGIEDLNDWFGFEVDEEDPIYGAKITAAVYLDYLRLHKYYSAVTWSPFAKKAELEPVFPEGHEAISPAEAEEMPLWEDKDPAYEMRPKKGMPLRTSDDAPASAIRYIGPFTPLDEEGFPIPERSGPDERSSQIQ